MLKMPLSIIRLEKRYEHRYPKNCFSFRSTFSFGGGFFIEGDNSVDHKNTICLDDFAIRSEIDKLRFFNFTKEQCFDDLNEALMWYIENQTGYDPKNTKHNNLPEINYEQTVSSFNYSGTNVAIPKSIYVRSQREVDIKNFLGCTQDGVFSIEKYHLKYQNPSKKIKSFKAFSFDIEIWYKGIISHDIFDVSE